MDARPPVRVPAEWVVQLNKDCQLDDSEIFVSCDNTDIYIIQHKLLDILLYGCEKAKRFLTHLPTGKHEFRTETTTRWRCEHWLPAHGGRDCNFRSGSHCGDNADVCSCQACPQGLVGRLDDPVRRGRSHHLRRCEPVVKHRCY